MPAPAAPEERLAAVRVGACGMAAPPRSSVWPWISRATGPLEALAVLAALAARVPAEPEATAAQVVVAESELPGAVGPVAREAREKAAAPSMTRAQRS